MQKFLDQDFLLRNHTGRKLYHEFASKMPIIDYHCHLSPQLIAEDHVFKNLTEIWLDGDHYKWRAMRSNGVNEQYITGNKTDREKFKKWAATVPYTLRNPLYHWTHLELMRYFGITKILSEHTADEIFDQCNEKLQSPDFSTRNLLRSMNVKLVCTTDDPADTLEHHLKVKKDFEIPVFPAFRPDAALAVENALSFNQYLQKLEAASDTSICCFSDFSGALKKRHDFFSSVGCTVSDHGLQKMYAEEYTQTQINTIFQKLRSNIDISDTAVKKFKSAMLVLFAEWNHQKGWVQQFHLGALRNANYRMMTSMGPNTGWDSIGDYQQAVVLARFLDRMDRNNSLAKTILYNLNPSDNDVFSTMTGNFNDGSVAGKIQWGAAWWFLDQKHGIINHLNAISNTSLVSRFVGMLTDSRSFLSYPRHEYFRRVLCNLFGEEIENGELPDDVEWTARVIQDICFYNAKEYFGWNFLKEGSV